MHRWANVVAGQQLRRAAPASPPSASANDCAIQRGCGMHERRVPDRVDSRGRAPARPPTTARRATRWSRITPLTKPARAESNSMPGLLDGGRDRRMGCRRGCAAVGTHRAAASRAAPGRFRSTGRAGGRRDDRVEQSAGAAGAVGQLGRECRVTTGDAALVEQRRQREVGVGVALGHRPQHVECRAAGRVERLASPAGHVTRAPTRRGAPRGPSRPLPSFSCRAAGAARAARAATRCPPTPRAGSPAAGPAAADR